MWIGAGAAAGICLLYWLILLFYSGVHTSFLMFWLVSAAILGLVCVWLLMNQKKKLSIQIPLWLKVPFYTIVLFFLTVFVVSEALIMISMVKSTPKSLDYLIVLGSHEDGAQREDILKNRLDNAAAYLKENDNTLVIVSGGAGEGTYVPQAKAMYDYLVLQGISSSRIIMEKRSENTMQNIYYSRLLIEKEDASVGIVTSNYHVYRAVGIARKAGISPVYGIGASVDYILLPDFMVRECAAIFIEKLRGNL